MICDYCRRQVVTDSQGRCVNCGAPHETTQVGDPATLRTYLSYTERLKALGRQSRDALDDGRGRNR